MYTHNAGRLCTGTLHVSILEKFWQVCIMKTQIFVLMYKNNLRENLIFLTVVLNNPEDLV